MAPISVVIAMYLLYRYLNLAALGGIAVLLLLFPVNVWGSRKSEKLQGKIVRLSPFIIFRKTFRVICMLSREITENPRFFP